MPDDLNPAALRDPHGYSVKWHLYPEDVLPLWVADMDFPIAPEITQALMERLRYGIGYPKGQGDSLLLQAILTEQERKHGLKGLEPENLWLTSSVVPGIYATVLGLTSPGEEVLTLTPVYPPFLSAINDYGRIPKHSPMVRTPQGWEIDFEELERLVSPATRLLMLCNPQNPTGRVFRREELERLAEFALRHRLWVMSDELWANLVYEGPHIPIASLNGEIAARTVTLSGPCKTYNTAGLGGGVAISHNKALLERMKQATKGVMGHPNVMSMAMWRAGIESGQVWLQQTLERLRGNRDFLGDFLRTRLPQVGYVPPQGTYLALLDFTAFPFAKDVYQVMLKQAKVALNDGPPFGPGYQGYLRLNFATPREIVQEALERIAKVAESID
ncbi:MalY/PatB family protein [Meiothermus granaticius]|uniref:cysteine-S-conjugate beta-lyase n=1 Tax=Meiothermus granaticius NBRC 107808 TaxID=1227551 RepID=A0A399F9R0_9DEIN|nr:PatB family C-S lyase [Meiothermus granaticius]RIH92426.1 Cystathionine beta-lyase PatB [Meiothermus granaticius NBRC 107808]GEM87461.1 aminotransferase class I [Meiothermus granaticius NBRC 107808]